MEKVIEYIFSAIIIIFVGYICYQHFTSHPSDKYHNDSWKEKRRRKK